MFLYLSYKNNWSTIENTVETGLRNLGYRALPWFRALSTGNQIWFYVIDLPGFSALPGFRAPFCGDGQSTHIFQNGQVISKLINGTQEM